MHGIASKLSSTALVAVLLLAATVPVVTLATADAPAPADDVAVQRMAAPFRLAADRHATEWRSLLGARAFAPQVTWRIQGAPGAAGNVASMRGSARMQAVLRERHG